ncbi:protein MIZU-KUSSEI 1-like [Durio zibethinus]|uniref:Protein MIZU-KUSSEI 1-like n=1 Tax=Durio zibethinus TaxID=66656 RepID=A0A6P5YHQ7_DURZI|nr:protein MIZU-KUSSEI 1-like [Durio zibethinus]
MEASAETSVNSQHQLTLGNLSRLIMDLLAPFWACNKLIFSRCLSDALTLVTGTIICPINGNKVKLCLQENTKSVPLVFIELPLSTAGFTSSIDCGVRIVLEPVPDSSITQRWVTYCNGQKVGFARRLEVGEEKWVLEMMQMVSTGAGILFHKGSDAGGYKYLRGQFEQIIGSDDSEAYHLADPSYWFGQEFSVFFLSN